MSEICNIRCELVSGEEVSFLEGKLKTLIDSMGLPEKQEKAQKDMVRIVLWDWFNYITHWNYTDHSIEKRSWYQDQFGLKPIKEISKK